MVERGSRVIPGGCFLDALYPDRVAHNPLAPDPEVFGLLQRSVEVWFLNYELEMDDESLHVRRTVERPVERREKNLNRKEWRIRRRF